MQSLWKFLGLDLYIAWFPCSNEESRSGVLPVKEVFICGFGTLCSRTTSAQYCQTAHKQGAQLDSSVLGLVGLAWRSCGGFGWGPSSNQLSTRRYSKWLCRKDQRGLPPTRSQELLRNTLPTIHNVNLKNVSGSCDQGCNDVLNIGGDQSFFFRGEITLH